jgi:hypothetical protein
VAISCYRDLAGLPNDLVLYLARQECGTKICREKGNRIRPAAARPHKHHDDATLRVDDEFRWAPGLCRRPNPGRARTSASLDDQTHGRKLYSLFARNRDEYLAVADDSPVAVGQVIVKQSWIPEEITDVEERPKSETAVDYQKVITTAVLSKPPSEQSDDERDRF